MKPKLKNQSAESLWSDFFLFRVLEKGMEVYCDLLHLEEITRYTMESLYLPSNNNYLDLAFYYDANQGFVLNLP